MDLEEWEVLPEDGFLQIHDDSGKKIFSRRYNTGPNSVFNMNYFICPPQSNSSNQFVETTNQLVPLPLPLPLPVQFIGDHQRDMVTEAEPDRVSQVFFKKMKETEFPCDMKLDSPKSNNKVIVPQIDVGEVHKADQAMEGNNFSSSPRLTVDDDCGDDQMDGGDDPENGGLNIRNWSMTGIGAICSFGIAAVVSTVCILFVGNQQKHRQNQKLRFQIYSDDKRIKQMVHHANQLNEAISGVPITRAHIKFGGYYDAL